MITIEPAGGASSPSAKVVMSGALSSALPASAPRAD
jgi:hypothetical protein